MPQPLMQKITEALNVSSTFNNCFFHTYALHLLANNNPLPPDLFQFISIGGPESWASKLRAELPDVESLSLISAYQQLNHPDGSPISQEATYEKTLVLGVLLREWFATKIQESDVVKRQVATAILPKLQEFVAFAQDVGLAPLIPTEDAFLESSVPFVRYILSRPKAPDQLSDIERQFESYFENAATLEQALHNYWMREGYLHHARLLARPYAMVSAFDVCPLLESMGQPLKIYNQNGEIIREINEDAPSQEVMEVKLTAQHYYLFKTPKTEAQLDDYDRSNKDYFRNRTDFLSKGLKSDALEDYQSTPFLGAICPEAHIGQPFDILINKIKTMRQSVVENYDKKITAILEAFDAQVHVIDEEQFPEAARVAAELVKSLNAQKNQLIETLQNPNTRNRVGITQFIMNCNDLVQASRPVLDKELGWADRLKILLKQLYNAVASVLTSNSNRFYKTVAPSQMQEAFEETIQRINPLRPKG